MMIQANPSNATDRQGPPSAQASLLCIEDDRETAALLVEELVERGYDVRTAHNGRDGVAAIMAERPDLVLCDISMPQMSGLEVLEQVAALGRRYTDMPFIFLTALADRDNELRGRQMGADDYVTKPIDFEVLDTILRARLARVVRTPIYRRELSLSDREAETLTWSARGKTSDEIAQIIGVSRRTVDFHLDNARSKLGVATRIEAVANAVAARLIVL
jgi:DNA-binding response OmpR family regulator